MTLFYGVRRCNIRKNPWEDLDYSAFIYYIKSLRKSTGTRELTLKQQ